MLTIDAIARRFGCFPHEVLDLTPWQLGLAFQCVQQAAGSAAQAVERIRRSTAKSMIPAPIPVVVIPSPFGGM